MSNKQLSFDRMREDDTPDTHDKVREDKEAFRQQQASEEQPNAGNDRPTGEQRARGTEK